MTTIRIVTVVTAFGWDGILFKKKQYEGVLTKNRLRKLQNRWDKQYGGFMRYETKEIIKES